MPGQLVSGGGGRGRAPPVKCHGEHTKCRAWSRTPHFPVKVSCGSPRGPQSSPMVFKMPSKWSPKCSWRVTQNMLESFLPEYVPTLIWTHYLHCFREVGLFQKPQKIIAYHLKCNKNTYSKRRPSEIRKTPLHNHRISQIWSQTHAKHHILGPTWDITGIPNSWIWPTNASGCHSKSKMYPKASPRAAQTCLGEPPWYPN